MAWVRVNIKIDNVGRRKLKLRNIRTGVNRILPLRDDYRSWIEKGSSLMIEGEKRIIWTNLDKYDIPVNLSIEPGESDHIYYDYILTGDITMVEVYTEVPKPSWFGKSSEVWLETSLYTLNPATPN